jgi:hypothetical protein
MPWLILVPPFALQNCQPVCIATMGKDRTARQPKVQNPRQ